MESLRKETGRWVTGQRDGGGSLGARDGCLGECRGEEEGD